MVELSNVDCFPVGGIVALRAVRAQPAFVLIRVACGTGRREAQKRVIQIRLDSYALQRRNL